MEGTWKVSIMYGNDGDISYDNDVYANFIKRCDDAGMEGALIQS